MINYLRHMAVFVKVVDEGAFRAAARELGVAPSRVSETVSDLEQYLGVTLFYRTTRKLFLTNEGQRFYAHVVNITKSAELGVNELNSRTQDLIGELKVSLPAFLASSALSSAIAEFAHQYPKVSLHINYTDTKVDILKEGLDMCIRAGWPQDSSMMSRKLGESRRFLVAGKAYVDARPLAKHPSDLADWDWVHFSMRNTTTEFVSKKGDVASVTEKTRIKLNSAGALLHFVEQNLGLTILPEHLVTQGIKSGELVHVLPQWEIKPLGIYALWPDASRRENLTLQLVRFLAERDLS
ncbi:transcriptional regulator, LysR family [Glaciecola sp. 4H-3-7+YE-5]|nr:transcriptional regulator, LysR family [Glaciecola sp. 4H-3-7+YE-5]